MRSGTISAILVRQWFKVRNRKKEGGGAFLLYAPFCSEVPPNPYATLLLYAPLCSGGPSQPLRPLITLCSFVFRRSLPTPRPPYYCMLLCVQEVPPNPYAPFLLYAPLCSGGRTQKWSWTSWRSRSSSSSTYSPGTVGELQEKFCNVLGFHTLIYVCWIFFWFFFSGRTSKREG